MRQSFSVYRKCHDTRVEPYIETRLSLETYHWKRKKRRRFVGIFPLLTTLGHVISVQPVTEILVKVTTYNVSLYETETKMCSFNENKRESGK